MKFFTTKFLLSAAACVICSTANAKFFVDYQGLEIEAQERQEKADAAEKKQERYRILTDKSPVLEEIGTPAPTPTNSFGVDMPLRDAIALLIPDKWIAYIDKQIRNPGEVDFQAENEAWTRALATIGVNYGYRFVVNWDDKTIQIERDPSFISPDYSGPKAFTDADSGRVIYVYTDEQVGEKDANEIVVEGKKVPVRIKD